MEEEQTWSPGGLSGNLGQASAPRGVEEVRTQEGAREGLGRAGAAAHPPPGAWWPEGRVPGAGTQAACLAQAALSRKLAGSYWRFWQGGSTQIAGDSPGSRDLLWAQRSCVG